MTRRRSRPSAPRSSRSAPPSRPPASPSAERGATGARAGLASAAPELGGLTLLALGVNGIVGAGIFFAPAIVAASVPGPRASWLYLLVALGCLPVALVFARLSRALPRDGGPCLYAERAFGRRVSDAIGAVVWVSALFSTATVTRALAELFAKSLPLGARTPQVAPVVGIAIVAALAIVNLRGLRVSALAWTVLTALKLAPLIALVAIAPFVPRASSPPLPAEAPLGPALLAILFALQGFEIVSLPAGRAKDPARTVPRATVASLVLAGGLYALIHLACARALPILREAVAPIPATAAIVGGPKLAWAIGAGVLASIAGITVGMHAMTPRYLSAMLSPAEDAPEEVAPAPELETDARSDVARVRPVVISAVAVGLMVAIGPVSQLAGLSSIAVLVQYAVTAAALIELARRGAEGLRPRDAWPAPLALLVVVALLTQATRLDLAIAAGVGAAAVGFGALVRRGRARST